MKLWQKVFFLSIFFMVIVTLISSQIILKKTFEMNIESELIQSVSTHKSFSAGISNNVIYERLKSNKIILSAEDTANVIKGLSQLNSDTGIAVFHDNNTITSIKANVLDTVADFKAKVHASEDYLTIVSDYDKETYIITGSEMKLEGETYALFTVYNITNVYDNYTTLRQYTIWLGIVSAGLFAAVMLLMVFYLLKPLTHINKIIREIANGNYRIRLAKKGGREFSELAANINVMSEAIETNIDSIQKISDGRKQFIDNLAHEMKTPLTSILGFADILRIKRYVSDHQRAEYAGIIVEETKRLQGLSGKLLELATTSNIKPDFEIVDLKNLFVEVVRGMIPIFRKKNLVPSYDALDDIKIYVDKALFKSLIYNIIENAAKASRDGQQIRITCSRDAESVMILISDDGIGMKKEDIDKVIMPFYMVDKARSREAGGAGLGLALCVEIVKLHNAKIGIESEIGVGTTVSIILPLMKGKENED